MSTTLDFPREFHEAAVPTWPVMRFSVADYQRLAEIGFLHEDDNLELLEGWLVPKVTKNPLHDSRVDLLDELLSPILPRGWYCRTQNVLVTSDSCPEPDVAVIRGRSMDYERQHPTASNCALIIEVAASSVYLDRQKTEIYARAGVPEYWIANLEDWQVERMRGPQSDGTYVNHDVLRATDQAPIQIDGVVAGNLPLNELLKPPY